MELSDPGWPAHMRGRLRYRASHPHGRDRDPHIGPLPGQHHVGAAFGGLKRDRELIDILREGARGNFDNEHVVGFVVARGELAGLGIEPAGSRPSRAAC